MIWPKRTDILGLNGEGVYMTRWTLFQCRWFSIRIHKFHRSDNDVLHDHPWNFVTLILKGGYFEERFRVDVLGEGNDNLPPQRGGLRREWIRPLRVLFRKAEDRHRVILNERRFYVARYLPGLELEAELIRTEYVPSWSLCITGPPRRKWGFWCAKGWVHWKEFFGRGGCGEHD